MALSETKFLIFGGWGASSMLNDLSVFRSTDGTFTSIAEQSVSPDVSAQARCRCLRCMGLFYTLLVLQARKGASLVAIGTESFMFGGESDDGERLQDLWSLRSGAFL